MSEPGNGTEAAGADLSDEEMVEVVAGQTDSASENADVAGKDWDGDPSQAPAPAARQAAPRRAATESSGATGFARGREANAAQL